MHRNSDDTYLHEKRETEYRNNINAKKKGSAVYAVNVDL